MVFSCVTPGEKLGDEAVERRDTAEAIRRYDEALGEKPIMDFEWERIRDKRAQLVEGEWGPQLDALSGQAEGRDVFEHCHRLLTFRRASRDAATTSALATRTDELIERECSAQRLSASLPEDPAAAVGKLLTLLDEATRNRGPQSIFDSIAEAVGTTLAKPLRPSNAGTLADLLSVLTLRERLRAEHFPAKVDALLDPQLVTIAGRPLPAPTPKDAPARYLELVAARTRAQKLGAPKPALELLDRGAAEASSQVLVLIDEKVKARRYLEAAELLQSLTAKSERDHAFRPRLQALLDEAAAFHAEQAARLPPGYRQLLQSALAAAFSGTHRQALLAQRGALAPTWATNLELAASSGEGACAQAAGQVARSLASTGQTKLAVSLSVFRCAANERDEKENRSARYEAIEKYMVQETRQVGTRYVQVQTGTRQVQCSKPSSLEGYVWTGLCTEPVYEKRAEPVYETFNVEKERTVERQHPYTVLRRNVTAQVGGTATFTWVDGTRFEVPFEASSQSTGEAWSYELPGKREHDPSKHVEQRLSPGLTAAAYLQQASSSAAGNASRELHARLRAHRAQRAREEGRDALKAGDEATAAEAFVRSVLHDGKAEGEAATWLVSQLGVPAARINVLLSESGLTTGVPTEFVEAVAAEPYTQTGPVAADDGFLKTVKTLEKDVSAPTTENYREGIRMPNEIVGVHFGLLPWDYQTGSQLGQRVSANASLEIQYHPLEMLGLTYGLVVHDQATVRVSLGFITPPRREYTNGEKETGFSMTIDASYALHVGLRFHYFSLVAGMQAGYQHAASGESWAYGFHVEPSARLTLRLFRTQQLIIEATGFIPFIPGVARKDRLTLGVPLPLINKDTYLKFMVERAQLQGSHLADDGETRELIGPVTYSMAAALIGFRF